MPLTPSLGAALLAAGALITPLVASDDDWLETLHRHLLALHGHHPAVVEAPSQERQDLHEHLHQLAGYLELSDEQQSRLHDLHDGPAWQTLHSCLDRLHSTSDDLHQTLLVLPVDESALRHAAAVRAQAMEDGLVAFALLRAEIMAVLSETQRQKVQPLWLAGLATVGLGGAALAESGTHPSHGAGGLHTAAGDGAAPAADSVRWGEWLHELHQHRHLHGRHGEDG